MTPTFARLSCALTLVFAVTSTPSVAGWHWGMHPHGHEMGRHHGFRPDLPWGSIGHPHAPRPPVAPPKGKGGATAPAATPDAPAGPADPANDPSADPATNPAAAPSDDPSGPPPPVSSGAPAAEPSGAAPPDPSKPPPALPSGAPPAAPSAAPDAAPSGNFTPNHPTGGSTTVLQGITSTLEGPFEGASPTDALPEPAPMSSGAPLAVNSGAPPANTSDIASATPTKAPKAKPTKAPKAKPSEAAPASLAAVGQPVVMSSAAPLGPPPPASSGAPVGPPPPVSSGAPPPVMSSAAPLGPPPPMSSGAPAPVASGRPPAVSSAAVPAAAPSGSPASAPAPAPAPGGATSPVSDGKVWQPAVGATWQIKLSGKLADTSMNVDIFDIDMEVNDASTIAALHAKGKKVICYFSAGSYEPGRSDSSKFQDSDKGHGVDGWPGEFWLKLSSPNVRSIMTKRLDVAKSKGCDAVDPDNMDGYDNVNGLGLKEQDSIDFLNFLADAAHQRGLAIGLKNSGAIIPSVISKMQFAVNEECVKFKECAKTHKFIEAGKPVFGIEYPKKVTALSQTSKNEFCKNKDAKGFSTVLKKMNLNDFVVACPPNV